MPVPWLTVLQNVPWSDVIKNAPKVADGARKLWQSVGKKPQAAAAAPANTTAAGTSNASALTGLAVLRMYFSLFCGRSDALAHTGLRFGLTRRESWTFVALVITLIGFGVVPHPLVDSRFAASDDILQLRRARMLQRATAIRVVSAARAALRLASSPSQ